MKLAIYAGTTLALTALLGVMIPTNVLAWQGSEGCTPGYWRNNADTNPRIAELEGISLRAALLDITGIDLTFIDPLLTIDVAITLNGGEEDQFLKHAAAAVYNIYYPLDYIEPTEEFTDAIQMAADGDLGGAKDILDAANNLGCPIDAFGNPEE